MKLEVVKHTGRKCKCYCCSREMSGKLPKVKQYRKMGFYPYPTYTDYICYECMSKDDRHKKTFKALQDLLKTKYTKEFVALSL